MYFFGATKKRPPWDACKRYPKVAPQISVYNAKNRTENMEYTICLMYSYEISIIKLWRNLIVTQHI